jgi:hypothetical protein
MNKREWLKFIRHSTEAHHIREIFNGTYALIIDPAVKHMFFARIDYLLSSRIDQHTRTSLENLKEDIEDEAETGRMRANGLPPRLLVERQMKPRNPDKVAKYRARIESMLSEIRRLEGLIEKEREVFYS